METSKTAAIDALNDCINLLKEVVPRVSMNREVTLSAVTPHLQTFQTTFGREVRVFTSHYHHSITCLPCSSFGLLHYTPYIIGQW